MLLLAGAGAAGCAHREVAPDVALQVHTLPMPGLGRERALRVLLPASYATSPQRRYPALYLHDSQNLFDAASAPHGGWGVRETMARLAHDSGFEAIVIGIDHGGTHRIAEMLPSPRPPRFAVAEGDTYADFVVRTVKPFVDARWRTRADDAAHNAIGGSSLGAVISQHALLRHRGVFGRALLFSPAYWIAPELVARAEREPLPADSRICLYAGGRESGDMLPRTEAMLALLQRQGTAATLRAAPDAQHDESAWRAAFEPALRWLFELPAR